MNISSALYHFVQDNTEQILRSVFGEHYVSHTGYINNTCYGFKFNSLTVLINVDGVNYTVGFTGAGGMMALKKSNIDITWSTSFEILLEKIRKHTKA